MARFATLPFLPQFFELEKLLANLLGVRVDLLLEDGDHAAPVPSSSSKILWVWQ
jgi:hypothetical protein